MTLLKAPMVFLLVGLSISLTVLLFPSTSVTFEILILGISVAVLGLPHGASDAYVAQQDGLWQSIGGLATFSSAYLIVALIVIGFWVALPVLSLAGFLIVSSWHFGADANSQNGLERWLFGFFLLSLPAFFNPAEVLSLFETLSGYSARWIASVLQIISPLAALGVVIMMGLRKQRQPGQWQDWAIVLGLIVFAWKLSPIAYFLVYFCALHSPKHLSRVMKIVPPQDRIRAFQMMVVFTTLTVLIAAVFFRELSQIISMEQTVLRIVFIGLAALTVPHMILVDGVCQHKLGGSK